MKLNIFVESLVSPDWQDNGQAKVCRIEINFWDLLCNIISVWEEKTKKEFWKKFKQNKISRLKA
ncbi:hypothetical protein [Helicobacter sp.]|uniref:hypothetical protein n=1 Tax=Helicobacter sp. TaxID=218 RepID=UPI0025B96296|nr:hypothetical protein [Helicobacter sp.]MCI5968350.1 hypothetical protein [Helicobacter sp.]MDY2584841.1 hypothetical protein [Helicobacter sp.]